VDQPRIVGGVVQPNPTIQLETADLKELAESGELKEKPNATIALELSDLKEIKPGAQLTTESKVIVDLDAGQPAPPPQAPPAPEPAPPSAEAKPGTPLRVHRSTPSRPRVDLGRRAQTAPPVATRSRTWLVIIVYAAAAAALGASVYFRFVA
jgi:hypothetical protein